MHYHIKCEYFQSIFNYIVHLKMFAKYILYLFTLIFFFKLKFKKHLFALVGIIIIIHIHTYMHYAIILTI